MYEKFSSRYGFKPEEYREPVYDDAPKSLRALFINTILTKLTFIDRDARYRMKRPIGVKSLYEEYCVLIYKAPEEQYEDSWHCNDILENEIRNCEWYHFFDFVELVGIKMKEFESSGRGADWEKVFSFAAYRDAVNVLFEAGSIGWRLDADSNLKRELPEVLKKIITEVKEQTDNDFPGAYVHLKKAENFLFSRPGDFENAVKETIMAVESIGRTLYPNASTLGYAIKEMRKTRAFPNSCIAVIEKYWAYACGEPGVRHGATTPGKVRRSEADFCFFVGIAIVRYLIEKAKEIANKAIQT